MKKEILDIIAELNPYVDINVDTKLLEEKILDSVTLLILVNELEEKYGITIPMEEIGPDDFEDVNSIELLVKMKRGTND